MQCPSCGGIIGRDCFNPIECAQITQQMQINDEVERRVSEQRVFNNMKVSVDFATWYSGMERTKVESAYERYLIEVVPNILPF